MSADIKSGADAKSGEDITKSQESGKRKISDDDTPKRSSRYVRGGKKPRIEKEKEKEKDNENTKAVPSDKPFVLETQ